MRSKNQQTRAKMEREQAVKLRRMQKQQKRRDARLAKQTDGIVPEPGSDEQTEPTAAVEPTN